MDERGILMKISTEIDSIAKHVGEHKAVELCAKAGFDGWDFSLFDMCRYLWPEDICLDTGHPLRTDAYLKYARELKQIGLDNGIVCNQSHAPFPVDVPAVHSYLKRAIECTAEAGGEICVIHPSNHWSPEKNAEMFFELLPFAKECGVKIATENMWNWNKGEPRSCFAACSTADSFCKHLEAVNDDYFVACLDLGHAEMEGSGDGAAKMIRAIGPKLQALHIHDNDLIHDSHAIPFSMSIDFDAVIKALQDVRYSGWFTLECIDYLTRFDKDTVLSGLRDMAAVAQKLVQMFES